MKSLLKRLLDRIEERFDQTEGNLKEPRLSEGQSRLFVNLVRGCRPWESVEGSTSAPSEAPERRIDFQAITTADLRNFYTLARVQELS